MVVEEVVVQGNRMVGNGGGEWRMGCTGVEV